MSAMNFSPFPERLQHDSVDDALFQRAYNAVPDTHRAWLKRCIAQLWEHYSMRSPVGARETCETLTHHSGLMATQGQRPLSWCLLLLDETLISPARLLAAALPPLLAGVEHVQVVRLCARKKPWPPALLAALELAGVEQVAQCPAQDSGELFQSLVQTPRSGVVLMPQPLRSLARNIWLDLAQAPGCHLWQPVFSGRAAVLAQDPGAASWDLDILTWSQPDLMVDVWYEEGPDGLAAAAPLPGGWCVRRGGLAALLQETYDLILAPGQHHAEALRKAPLVLGPGQEGCFIWPGLTPCIFQQSAAAWRFSGDAPSFAGDFFRPGAGIPEE